MKPWDCSRNGKPYEVEGDRSGIELDLVTHDILKFFLMLLKKNGYVLEQLFAAQSCKRVSAHGTEGNCKRLRHPPPQPSLSRIRRHPVELFQKENPPRVKPLLYLYRVLLTGIHLMRAGRIEANLLSAE